MLVSRLSLLRLRFFLLNIFRHLRLIMCSINFVRLGLWLKLHTQLVNNMPFAAKPPRKNPVYFEHHADGYWCSIDGIPEYFKTKHEMYLFACEDERELIEITHENESQLRESGAFDRCFHE